MMGFWIDVLVGLALLVVVGLGVRMLADMRRQLEAMRRGVETIERGLDAQNAQTTATLQAIAKSVETTTGHLSRIETAWTSYLRR